MRSISGTMFFLANGLIHFYSSRQRITVSSTTEAELYSTGERRKVRYIPFQSSARARVVVYAASHHFSDSQGALHLSSNANYSNKSKHLAIRFYSLKDLINNDQLIVNHVRTGRQLADILTRYCEKTIHRRLLDAVVDFET
ncbi:unnamed protein product [Sphacelaria rigidula]